MFKPQTRKLAIDAKCRDCIADPANGGSWLQQVENCVSEETCSLWEFRPVTSATLEVRKAEKIAKMSPDELERYRKKQEGARERFKHSR